MSFEKRRILLVDDEADLVFMLEARLKANGYEVLKAYDGETGLETARKENPDLILLDVMMPKMDGYKVCSLLKDDERYAKIPIVLFTAKAGEQTIQASKEAGADDYILKPFEPSILLDKIRELLAPL